MSKTFEATAASNIAFLKYWGKRDGHSQWPANDSFSMTLSSLCSQTRACRTAADDHRFVFEGKICTREDKRFTKTFKHLDYLSQSLGYQGSLEISSSNNFPTGAGIASSASGLAALTLASLAAWLNTNDWNELAERGLSRSRLANLARMGSGSAGRSLFGGYVLWRAGETPESQVIEPYRDANHWALGDSVVLFSTQEKALGSTEAHAHAWTSPLFRPRLAGLPARLKAMQMALAQRDWEQLGPLLETEALEMHAVIMTAQPSHNYLNQAALDFLVELREARARGEHAAYFTIDAGPNIHVLYPMTEAARTRAWLASRMAPGAVLHDQVGEGPGLKEI